MKLKAGRIYTFILLILSGNACSTALVPFAEPPEIQSQNGVLETELSAQEEKIQVGEVTVTSKVYNGLLLPPTLSLRPGDTIRRDSARWASPPPPPGEVKRRWSTPSTSQTIRKQHYRFFPDYLII